MDRAGLEAKWDEFLANDVPVERFLALEFASLDNDEFGRLQQIVHEGDDQDKRGAAHELAALTEDVHSALVIDGIVAAAFDGAHEYDGALALRGNALPLAARWHPGEAARALGNIGFDLLKLGRIQESRQWYERALAWDPWNPFVLVGLAEVALEQDDLPTTFGLREAMVEAGQPASHLEELDHRIAERGARRPSLFEPAPGLGALGQLDEVGFFRFAVASQYDRNLAPLEGLRNHAIAAAMRGRRDAALFAAGLSAASAWNGFASVEEVHRAWAREVHRAMTGAAPDDVRRRVEAGQGLFAASEEERVAEAQRRVAAKDAPALEAALYDPHPLVRLLAAEALLPTGSLSARRILEAAVGFEEKKGIAAARPADVGLAATHLLAADRRRRRVKGHAVSLIPEEGIDHPVFDALDKGEALSVMLTFVDDAPAAQLGALPALLARWQSATGWDAAGGKPDLTSEADGASWHVVLTKPTRLLGGGKPLRPREPVRKLLELVRDQGPPLAEIMLARLHLPRKGEHFWHAVDDPRDRAEHLSDEDQMWRASFDPKATPPASEPEGGLFILMPTGKGTLAERRNMRLWIADVRIVYGLPSVDYRDIDTRSAEVASAIAEGLDACFRGGPPSFFNRAEEPGGIDAIVCRGRKGHAFALQGQNDRMLAHYPTTFRYREYELMRAMREVMGATGLAPVVHWYREGGLYILNLWERA